MGKTIVEKILSTHSEKDAKSGDIVLAKVDFLMAQDGTAPLVIKTFENLGINKIFNQNKVAFVIDHNSPSPNEGVSALHKLMRDFVKKYGIEIFEVGEGVCHVVVPEKGKVKPGDLVLGADSHTPTYGALNCMACGVGSTDLAIALATGSLWFKVPQTIKIEIKGEIPFGVFGKDIALYMVKNLTSQGAIYRSVEIKGETVKKLSMDERFTICNMTTEIGAKCGIMEFDEKTKEYLENKGVKNYQAVFPDKDAIYEKEFILDISNLKPQVAKPHNVDNVCDINQVEGIEINQGFIGTCTNGRVSDFEIAAKILKGKKIKNGVRLICTCGSREIYIECLRKGYIEVLIESGACVTNPGCGPCVGTHQGIPSDGEVVISTANRNFKGRMGNPKAFIYLASPATVAASCIEGKITDPRKYL
ncbi:MAG: 3-isopropylmalate dehydratase large subunit [Candidatus Omnitrophica bacterium]|nr:3-isopropylmalate dehydratase large subunit [Candidatus Omnitrophota bacterium]MCM8808882.1 3-isopropylmalate dehydratase large subunit [Candidatus Omnitrophota bacterium]